MLHVRRYDADIVPTPDLMLEFGDRVGVLMPPDRKEEVRKAFGDTVKATAEFSYVSLGIGMVLGILLGLIPIPIPGVGKVTLGIGGGPLIVALILGKLRRTGPMLWTMPLPANIVLRNYGLAIFLAAVGINAGQPFVRTVAESGLTMLFIGAAVLLTTVLIVLIVGLLPDEDSLRRSGRRRLRRDRQSGDPGLFDADGADRTARHRLRHDLSVDDDREGDRGADRGLVAARRRIGGGGAVTEKAPPPQTISFDAILPSAMALRAEAGGVTRAAMDPLAVFVLSVLAGAFISFGAVFATTVGAGGIGPGCRIALRRRCGCSPGIVFCAGLILVVVGGAELFTGNNMLVMAWASGKVTTRAVLANWVIVFAGNFVGAIATAALVFVSTQYTFGGGSVGLNALTIANGKTALAFVPAFTLGILCNALVCLAVWMCYGARTTIDRVVTIVPPISAFVAAGFEHSIANIYFIPMGLFIKAGAPKSFWKSIGKTPADFPSLTWDNFSSPT